MLHASRLTQSPCQRPFGKMLFSRFSRNVFVALGAGAAAKAVQLSQPPPPRPTIRGTHNVASADLFARVAECGLSRVKV